MIESGAAVREIRTIMLVDQIDKELSRLEDGLRVVLLQQGPVPTQAPEKLNRTPCELVDRLTGLLNKVRELNHRLDT